MLKKITTVSASILIVSLTTLVGCGPGGPETADVSGTITLDGKPLQDAEVYFSPVEGGRTAVGRTDESGTYELHFTASKSGAMLGAHEVAISTFTEPSADDDGNSVPGKPELVPKKYRSGGESALTVEVQSGSNTLDFELDSN